MAYDILSVTETFDTRSIKLTTERTRDYVRTFNVVTNSRDIPPELVQLATGLPRLWNVYVSAIGTYDLLSLCKEVEAKQDTQDPYTWRVTCRYSNKINRPDLFTQENPTLRPAEVEYDTVEVLRPVWKDILGNPIWNSSKERFDPPPEKEERRLSIKITRNQLTYDPLFYLNYEGAVNSDTWLGFKPGRVKCCKARGKRMYEAGYFFWQAYFELQVRLRDSENPGDDAFAPDNAGNALKAWQLELLDRGYMEINEAGYQVILRDLATGTALTSPVLLRNGRRLPVGESPVFLYFEVCPRLKFAKLDLI